MSVTINKRISREKEVFLSVCLLAGEVSSETIRRMKRDFGESRIKNNVIQSLSKSGYITKVGYKSNYGYQLTDNGLEYLKIKFPKKYDYSMYAKSHAYIYKQTIRERARQLSMVLYTMTKQGVSIENNNDIVSNILNGYEVHVERPFFITTKALRELNVRFTSLYGARIFGYIISSQKIVAIYAPDKEHHLSLKQEEAMTTALLNVLKYSCAPYNNQRNYEILYMFSNHGDVVDSFIVGDKINNRLPITKRVYEKYIYKQSYIFFMDDNPYTLKQILDNKYIESINNVFKNTYGLTEFEVSSLSSINIHGYYNNDGIDIPTAICWTFSPSVILGLVQYCKQELAKDEKVMILCFVEQLSMIKDVLKINKKISGHILAAELPCGQVHKLINGEISNLMEEAE